jgi:glutamate-1-semialdehyde 2,1-aminomutase
LNVFAKSNVLFDTKAFARFFHALVREGVYIPPSQYEAWFVSLAHSEKDVKATIDAVRRALDRTS